MARCINNVVLFGRLTDNIELKKTTSGTSVTTFTVALDRYIPKHASNPQQTADFIQCVAWDKGAEYLSNYAKKGMQIHVVGKLQSRSYETQNGKRFVTEVVASDVGLIFEKKQEGQTQEQAQSESYGIDTGTSNMGFDDSNLPF